MEGPGQYDRVLKSVPEFRADYPDFKAGVVTNFGGLDSARLAAPLIQAGYHCIVESHIKENEEGTPERQIDFATRVLEWPGAQVMVGLGRGATLDDYPGVEQFAGWSVFAAEELYKP